MQSLIIINGENLYKFWGGKIYLELYKDEDCIVNLAKVYFYKT
ncbi:MAG: YaaA family protein [Oscillospiraceae bacterium]|nr:YaaA family protein [Oscillospiraceae bacterium]